MKSHQKKKHESFLWHVFLAPSRSRVRLLACTLAAEFGTERGTLGRYWVPGLPSSKKVPPTTSIRGAAYFGYFGYLDDAPLQPSKPSTPGPVTDPHFQVPFTGHPHRPVGPCWAS